MAIHSVLIGSAMLLNGMLMSSAGIAQSADHPLPPKPGPGTIETQYCEAYNATGCDSNSNSSDCFTREDCGPHDPDKRNHCFVLWHNNTGTVTLKLKGCFLDSTNCYDQTECVAKVYNSKTNLLFCCCEGNSCNKQYGWVPTPTEAPPPLMAESPVEPDEGLSIVLLCTLIPLSVIFIIMVAFYCLYRHRKMNLFNELPTIEPNISCPPSPQGIDEIGSLPVVLREVRARGRFGAVWRAHLNQQEVAVKIFPVQDKQSWISEQEIFKLPRMNHPDILQFIGVDKKGDNLQSEYWLITAYHEKGSLCDYLKAHTLTWQEACRIAATMSRGLTHLHDESANGQAHKPAVAHRDFKSKNVLLKRDMSACIADFGLALVFQPGKPCGDTHGQVGTRRYMAPEVLEGAINFTKDAFLRIDMYACGLVLWEIVSRCIAQEEPLGEYMLPLEEEVGSHPTLEEMQDAVVLRKVRPRILESWRAHNGLSVFCETMEECWDHDAEARLSASCVLERISSQTRFSSVMNNNNNTTSTTPLLIENAQPLPPKDPSN